MILSRSILIVDDEEKVIDVLKKTFEDDYTVYTSRGGIEGLSQLREHSVQVIITDERMPKMSGMQFLKEAQTINPRTVNIILTAYTDITVAIDAINSGNVYRYIIKPWDTEELRLTVRQAFELYYLQTENKSLTDELLQKNKMLESKIIELKTAQEKLLRTEKFMTIGQLTASIGHELKNPLSRIKSSAAVLQSEINEASDEVRELLRIIDNEVMISTKIINDLLDFSRERQAILNKTNLDKVIDQTLQRLKIPSYITIEKNTGSDIPDLFLDEGQIQQILVNVLLNAIQAMDENGGKLYIRTSVNADKVQLSIKDTGCGMNAEQIKKIFEPLYTTKPKGIGLGMSVVKMLLDKHNAEIKVESRENIGTTVTILFPMQN
ncbi:response regulator [bacterium]|nr:response regulator [bacterium]